MFSVADNQSETNTYETLKVIYTFYILSYAVEQPKSKYDPRLV